MKTATFVAWSAFLAVWLLLWGMKGGPSGSSVLLHWPIAAILLSGFIFNLRGGVAASCATAVFVVALRMAGAVDSWTLVAWQVLVYGIFGLYPFKFMQIREQRSHHYRTLIEYKRGETESLRLKLGEIERGCREIEAQLRTGPGAQ